MSPRRWRLLWILPLAFPWAVLPLLLEEARQRPDLVWVNGPDPASLDPAQATGTPEGRILRVLFEGLTQHDPSTLEPVPGMAQRWEVSSDGLEYRFFLRENARWSNGDRVSAHDFVWSWKRLLAPETRSRNSHLLWCVHGAREYGESRVEWNRVGVVATGDHQLDVRLIRPTPHFLFLTSLHPLAPVHRPTVRSAERDGVTFTSAERMVSNGPYRLSSRRLRHSIRMTRNPGYWDPTACRSELIEALAVESDNAALNLFLSGEADWIVRVPRAVTAAFERDPEFGSVYQSTPYFGLEFLRVNVKRPPFDDPEVRKALSMAIDRHEIVQRVTQAGEQPAWSFVPWPTPAIRAFEASLTRRQRSRQGETGISTPIAWYERAYVAHANVASDRSWASLGHDPAGARALLRTLGYRVPRRATGVPDRPRSESEGFTEGRPFPAFELLYNSGSLNERLAEILQDQWHRELGFEVRLSQQEWGSYLDRTSSLDYQVARSSWIGDYLDPMTFLEVLASGSPNNRTGWQHAGFDHSLVKSSQTTDVDLRARWLQDAEAVLLNELPVIPLYYYVTGGLVSSEFTGPRPNLLDLQSARGFSRRPAESRH